MRKDPNCIFCQIVDGAAPCHKIWENDQFIAFLSIFPNTDGFAVVAAKEHLPSDAFANDDKTLSRLVLASKQVGQKITAAFDDVGRTGMFLEGFGVDHLHSKLFPMHGTAGSAEWKQQLAPEEMQKKYFHVYEGYMSSHGGPRADDAKLAEIASKIRNAK